MVLQTTAWTGMIVTRSLKSTLAEALESSLDGQHPCGMCSVIASAKQTEERSRKEFDLLKKAVDLKFTEQLLPAAPARAGGAIPMIWPEWTLVFPVLSEAPPTPPPLA